ncbi:MAG: LysR family transcriptional regulator [Methanomassiliicoccales archaeon]|jgi:molybdate transport repressor ModE-like protein|nr:LysR family transcriptional regulator [Methanomassiliicoccales archaeon]
MKIEPQVSLIVDGAHVTTRTIEVLMAILKEGSQKGAAKMLNISIPVLHRYLKKLEKNLGTAIMKTTHIGTELTDEGKQIVMEYIALKSKLARPNRLVVGGTIITEDLLLWALTNFDKEGDIDLIISNDERNIQDFKAGLMDLVVLDDPLYVYDLENVKWEEIGEDRLIHVDRGSRYMKFMYGAQRIGFKHLESSGVPYEVKGVTRYLPALVQSPFSFFINESLLARRGLKIKSATPPNLLKHKIIAIYREEKDEILRFVKELSMQKIRLGIDQKG